MLAYSLSVHKNPEQVNRLINAIYTSEDFYYINIFGADSNKKQAEWMNHLKSFEKSNVFFSFKYSDSWGTIDQVRANIDAMMQFRELNYSYFINLSGQCYPIKSLSSIKEFLSKNKCSYIAYYKMPDYCEYAKNKTIYCPFNTKFHFRFEYCYYPIPNWYLIQCFKGLCRIRKDINLFIKIPRMDKKLVYTLELYKGSNWFCLYKDHVKYILDFLKENPDYMKLFSTVLCSDEHFFQTILLNSPLKTQIINDNLRYIDWDNPSYPSILSINNINDILESQNLFARKFDCEIDNKILDAIDVKIKNC